MPRGSKEKYTDKQKRKAAHIEKGYEDKGVGEGEAERRAWATVNKQSGGGERGGLKKSSRAKKSSRSDSAKRATATRKRNSSKKSTHAKKAAAGRKGGRK